MNKFERFFKTSGIFFLGNVFTKLISFFLLPLYTNVLNPAAFGEYNLVVSYTNLIIPLVFFQIWDSIFRFSFDYDNIKDRYMIINNGFFVMVIGTIVYSILFFLVIINFTINNIILIYFYSLMVGMQYFMGVVARSFNSNKVFVMSGVINSIITILLNIIMIVFLDIGIQTLYFSSIIGTFIQIFIINYKVKFIENLNFKMVNYKKIHEMIKFSLPLSVSTVAQWLLTGFTQVFIGFQMGTYYNGIFSVGNKFSSIIILFVGVFQFAWNEMAYMLANDENKDNYYNKATTEAFKLIIIGCSIFILVIKLIFPYFIDAEYNTALNIIPLLIIGTAFNSYSSFLGTIFLAEKNSNKLFFSTLLSSIVNIVGLVYLVPIFGLFGAALSLCVAFITGAISRIYILRTTSNICLKTKTYFVLTYLIYSVIVFYTIDSTIYIIIFLIVLILLCVIQLMPMIKLISLNFQKIKN